MLQQGQHQKQQQMRVPFPWRLMQQRQQVVRQRPCRNEADAAQLTATEGTATCCVSCQLGVAGE